MGETGVDDAELLMMVYRTISWDDIYELAPEVSRDEIDDLFRRLQQSIDEGKVAAGSNSPENTEIPEKAILRCDGASSGNPGPAGIGMALYDESGDEIRAWGLPLGEETNNVAEYRALMAGLRRSLKLGIRRIQVLSDSQLMVRQINGQYKVRNERLQKLHAESMDLLEQFESWTVEHVDRDENKRVDKIAKQQVERAKHART